jgi:hypothetical protein
MKSSTRSPKPPTTSFSRVLQRLGPQRALAVRAIREDLHDRDPKKAKTIPPTRPKPT